MLARCPHTFTGSADAPQIERWEGTAGLATNRGWLTIHCLVGEIRCFGCGAQVPDQEGPTHKYMLSAPGGWGALRLGPGMEKRAGRATPDR